MKIKKTMLLLFILVFLCSFFFISNTPTGNASYTLNRVFTSSSSDGSIMPDGDPDYETVRNATQGTQIKTGNYLRVGQALLVGLYYVHRGFLYFDTSVIPTSANIVNATLSIKIETNQSYTDFNITIQSGMPTYPHDPLQYGDYYYGHYSGNGGSISTSGMAVDNYYNITLTSQGISWIKKGGWTKLCLRSSRDIDNITPTGLERVNIYTAEAGKNYATKLYVTYTTEEYYSANLYGAYNEVGDRDGAINVTFYRPEQPSISFELNGTYNVTSEADTRLVFHFDLGNNQSRIYYWRYGVSYEDIYVFKPAEPYDTYYFTVVDYVGITHGYLESLINVNGSDIVVERWKLDVLNDLPFTLSWGQAYQMRVVCDQGTYIFGEYIAGPDTSINLAITTNAFPPSAIHIGNITVTASRVSNITIQINYTDNSNLTNWVYVTITQRGASSPAYTANNTGSTQQITWNAALPNKDYIVKVQVGHQEEGTLTWSFSCPALETATNPWDFGWIGNWPIDSTQLLGFLIVLSIFAAFSQANAKVGIIATVLTAMILTYIGWLNITWTWLTLVMCIAILAVFSLVKKRGY